ncbi:MAG: TetR/AcrR family transcriptional regulator [Pseudohongiellaceae bacterium]
MNTSVHAASTGAAKRRRVHKPPEIRQDEILAAAARVFAANGYRLTDMQEVADQAGVGKGTVYRYFPAKQELFLAALEQNLDKLSAFVENARKQHKNPLEKLQAGIHAYLTFFDDHPETVELFVQERAEFSSGDKPLYFVRSDEHKSEWAAEFAALNEPLSVRNQRLAVPAEQAMELLGFMLYGAVMSTRLANRTDRLAASSSLILHTFLHGVVNDTQ